MIKNIAMALISVVAGILMALYGVFLSVFADGNLNERLMLIAIVLVLFFLITYFLAKIQPRQAVLSVILTASPSIVVLIFQEFNGYIILYISAILLACGIGCILGQKSAKHKSSNPA